MIILIAFSHNWGFHEINIFNLSTCSKILLIVFPKTTVAPFAMLFFFSGSCTKTDGWWSPIAVCGCRKVGSCYQSAFWGHIQTHLGLAPYSISQQAFKRQEAYPLSEPGFASAHRPHAHRRWSGSYILWVRDYFSLNAVATDIIISYVEKSKGPHILYILMHTVAYVHVFLYALIFYPSTDFRTHSERVLEVSLLF